MTGLEMLYRMENIDPAYIEAADVRPKAKKASWLKWGGLAACLCLAAVGAVYILAQKSADRAVLQWSENFPAENYFKYNSGGDELSSRKVIDTSAVPYASERYFSDDRAQMEAGGVIPAMPDHPLYTCVVRYDGDGNIFSVTHAWHRRGDNYSDLTVTVGQQDIGQELDLLQDCIYVELDEDGNIVTPSVTVTERDGIQIVAQGSETQNKTITFQNDTAWYRIAGSWGDGYEPMAALLDWVWEHPVDFGMFTVDKGVEITHISLADYPDAFAAQIPDFEALGYFPGENYLQLKDGDPYTFEGHYYTGVTPKQVADHSYLEMEGWAEIHWCIDAQPDYYDLQNCMGNLSELTREQVTEALTSGSNFSFLLDGVFIKVYCKDAAEAWRTVETLKN